MSVNPGDRTFWTAADDLVAASRVEIDRPKGSTHPRIAGLVYPLDYGYLADTTGGDGDGIDVWLGTAGSAAVTGAVVTVDLFKRDAEVKFLLGCTARDVETITNFLNGTGREGGGTLRCLALERPEHPEHSEHPVGRT